MLLAVGCSLDLPLNLFRSIVVSVWGGLSEPPFQPASVGSALVSPLAGHVF